MEPIDNNLNYKDTLIINGAIHEYLKEFAKWARFISILGFIGIGFMVLGGLFVFSIGNRLNGFAGSEVPVGLMGIMYLLIGLLYWFPIYYLYKSSTKMRVALLSNSQEELTSSFEYLKSHYKFIGILCVIALSIYAVALVGGLLFASFL